MFFLVLLIDHCYFSLKHLLQGALTATPACVATLEGAPLLGAGRAGRGARAGGGGLLKNIFFGVLLTTRGSGKFPRKIAVHACRGPKGPKNAHFSQNPGCPKFAPPGPAGPPGPPRVRTPRDPLGTPRTTFSARKPAPPSKPPLFPPLPKDQKASRVVERSSSPGLVPAVAWRTPLYIYI